MVKPECFPLKIRNKGMMFALTTSIQDCMEIIASALGGKKRNSVAPKLICKKILKNPQTRLPRLISDLSTKLLYKTLIVFLCTNNEQLKF